MQTLLLHNAIVFHLMVGGRGTLKDLSNVAGEQNILTAYILIA